MLHGWNKLKLQSTTYHLLILKRGHLVSLFNYFFLCFVIFNMIPFMGTSLPHKNGPFLRRLALLSKTIVVGGTQKVSRISDQIETHCDKSD